MAAATLFVELKELHQNFPGWCDGVTTDVVSEGRDSCSLLLKVSLIFEG